MDVLPEEMLDQVFKYLTTPEQVAVCVRVCKRWQRLVERRSLALRVDGDERRLHSGTRAVLITNFPVDLIALLEDITAKCRFLRELTAHAPAPFHEPHLEALQLLPHLKHLDIFTRPRLLDERVATVCLRLHTLVANESLAPALLRDMATGSQLEALHMFGRSVHYPRSEMMMLLQDRASHLTDLTLRCNELNDAAFELIGACTKLHSLKLYSCWLMMGPGALAVCRPPALRVLHVTGTRLVRRPALADMLNELPVALYELVLSGGWFGDEHVKIVTRRVPELRILELWRCKLTSRGAQELAAELPKLEQLDLDVVITKRRLREMARHPTLREVRCMPEDPGHDPLQYMEDHPVCDVDGLRVIATHAPYARKYFRTGGEGFRSALFYYWTRDVPLEPLPPYSPPDFGPYEELFY